MIILSVLPGYSAWIEALLDSSLLVILLSPVLYLSVFRTLVQNIAKREKAEGELKKHRDHLEDLVVNRTAELTAANEKLKREIAQRISTEEELHKRTHDLRERVKELNCLYSISKLTEKPRISLGEIIQGIVDLIPSSWQYPEITCARISLNGSEYKTEIYKETRWRQLSNIKVYGKSIGFLEVSYMEEKPQIDEGPFLKEERSLIDAIAQRLGRILERIQAEERLQRELEVNAALSELYKPVISLSATVEDIALTVLKKSRDLTTSDHGYVSTIDPITGDNVSHTLTKMLKNGCTVTSDKGIIFPMDPDGCYPALWGHALNTREPFFTNSAQNHQAATGIPDGHIPIQRFLSVPVILGNELVGQIALANKDQDYTEKDLEAIKRVADFYALAIQRNRSREALQKAKDELEKRVEARTVELTIANTKLKKEIDERKVVEEQLQSSKSMLQSVFDGISDPLVLLDKGLRMKMLNRAAKDYYKLDRYQDVIGKHCHAAIRDRLEPCEGCKVPEAVSKDQHLTWERTGFIDPDRLEQVIAYPVRETDGKFGGTIIRISDMTEEKLRERQLIQSERLASLGLLVSGIAHEINNPNNFISFNIPILRDYVQALIPIIDDYAENYGKLKMFEMTYPEFRDDLFKILTNIEHGSTRINIIVSGLKRFAGKRGKEEKQWIDLKQVIEKTVAISRGEIRKNIRSFEIDIPDDLPSVYTDPEVIEQIVINLLINAAQAADKDDSWIKLKVALGDTWKDHVFIEIKDNGCGMDEKITENIFSPFFTTKEAGVGTGLGLYVCNDLIKGLGGRIEVQSKVGEGSTFSVILPDFERRSMKRLDS